MIKFKVIENVYKTETVFISDCEEPEFRKVLERDYGIEEKKRDCDGMCYTVKYTSGYKTRVIWVRKWSPEPYWMGVAFHEIFHLVVRILDERGIPIRDDINEEYPGDEAAAYLCEFFVNEYVKRLIKVNDGRKSTRTGNRKKNK